MSGFKKPITCRLLAPRSEGVYQPPGKLHSMSKTTKQKATSKPVKRRDELRRTVPKPSRDLKLVLLRPGVVTALLTGAAFVLAVSLLVIWSREQVKVDVGQIMTDTRLYRLTFSVEDEEETDQARKEARAQAQEVFTIKTDTLERLREPLLNLPSTVAQPDSFDEIEERVSRSRNKLDNAIEVDRIRRRNAAIDTRSSCSSVQSSSW